MKGSAGMDQTFEKRKKLIYEFICDEFYVPMKLKELAILLQVPKDQRNGKCQITISTSFFVPKPFTPFQWAPMDTMEAFIGKARVVNTEVKEQLNRKSLKYNWHQADVTILEGLLARGDRKVAKAILAAYNKGCIYDAI